MSPKELEVALIDKGISPKIAKLIVALTLSPNIERHEKGWLIPIAELTGSLWSKRTQQRFAEDLRSLIGASIVLEDYQGIRKFPVIISVEQARDSEYLRYSLSRSFMEWADSPSVVAPCALH